MDTRQGRLTPRSLHVVSRPTLGGRAPVVWVRSAPFAPPKTGRASLVAWIKIANPAKQPLLRLAIEGKLLDGQPYYRNARLGASEDGRPVKPLTADWAMYRYPLADLPLSGLTELRVGFDLMGEGEVWIDDVQLFDLWFEEHERDELLKNIATADVQVTAGQLSDGQRFLDGYWARFLSRHGQLPDIRPATAAGGERGKPDPIAARPMAADPAKPPKAKAESPSTWKRIKGWIWR